MASILDLLIDRVRFNRSDLESYLIRSPNVFNYEEQSELINKIVKLRRSIENLQDRNLRVMKDKYKLKKVNERLEQEVRDLDAASKSVSMIQPLTKKTAAPPLPLTQSTPPII